MHGNNLAVDVGRFDHIVINDDEPADTRPREYFADITADAAKPAEEAKPAEAKPEAKPEAAKPAEAGK